MSIRKILIPVAAGLLISPALMAADITVAGTTTATRAFSDEFLSTAVAASTVTGDILQVKLEAEYAVGDIITVAFSGAALKSGLLSSITSVTNAAISSVTIGLLSSDASSATYRVTDVTAGIANTTLGVLMNLAATNILTFDAGAVDVANKITVTYTAATDTGLALDSGGILNSVDYITTGPQFTAVTNTPFDGIIDVENNRTIFTGAVTSDLLIITTTAAGGFGGGAASAATHEYVITGDFSWIVDSDAVTAGIQPAAGVLNVGGANCTAIVVTALDLTYTCDATATLTINTALNLDASMALVVLPAGAFTGVVTVTYTGIGAVAGAGSKVVFSGSTGTWTLNGYQGLIPYMPFGSGISQVIYVVNRGVKVGDVTVDWVGLNGTSGTLGVVASLGAGTTLSLGPIIRAALPAAQQSGGRLGLVVTANVPAKDVQMNSQYNVSGNRAFTLHEDNRPAPSH